MEHKAVVLGGSGFAGAELLRVLALHPFFEVAATAASSNVGRPLTDLFPNLHSYEERTFTSVDEALATDADVVFSSLPFGESSKLFGDDVAAKTVDVSADFRLKDADKYEEWYGSPREDSESLDDWVYGLTEFHREQIKGADRVANPGCYAAAAILALGPLLEAGVVNGTGLHIDAKSGISGAGRASGEGFDFATANENTRPYAITGHKHIPEIEQELSELAGAEVKVTFVPHIVPMTRGIVATCVGTANGRASTSDVLAVLRDRYAGEPFVRVTDNRPPETKHLSGTNLAEVTATVDERTGKVIAISAIDNLGKGAAGQAIQNANLMMGFEETAGLEAAGMLP